MEGIHKYLTTLTLHGTDTGHEGDWQFNTKVNLSQADTPSRTQCPVPTEQLEDHRRTTIRIKDGAATTFDDKYQPMDKPRRATNPPTTQGVLDIRNAPYLGARFQTIAVIPTGKGGKDLRGKGRRSQERERALGGRGEKDLREEKGEDLRKGKGLGKGGKGLGGERRERISTGKGGKDLRGKGRRSQGGKRPWGGKGGKDFNRARGEKILGRKRGRRSQGGMGGKRS